MWSPTHARTSAYSTVHTCFAGMALGVFGLEANALFAVIQSLFGVTQLQVGSRSIGVTDEIATVGLQSTRIVLDGVFHKTCLEGRVAFGLVLLFIRSNNGMFYCEVQSVRRRRRKNTTRFWVHELNREHDCIWTPVTPRIYYEKENFSRSLALTSTSPPFLGGPAIL